MPANPSDPRKLQVADLPSPTGHDARPAPSSGRPAAPSSTQPCPRCGHPMPDLKGGTGSICSVCGFKDSCCY